jgi:hypothetical protein
MADERECYFCGTPNPPKCCSQCKSAWYCNVECQAAHWKLLASDTAHKAQCRAKTRNLRSHVDKADYHSYIATLPCCDELLDEIVYWKSAARSAFLVELANNVDYPLNHTFFRTHEFLQALVAHGKDTDDNMLRLYGFQLTQEEKDR